MYKQMEDEDSICEFPSDLRGWNTASCEKPPHLPYKMSNSVEDKTTASSDNKMYIHVTKDEDDH